MLPDSRYAEGLADLDTDEFLLVYGDQLHFFDYSDLIALHHEQGALATLVVKRSDLPQNGDMVELALDTGIAD